MRRCRDRISDAVIEPDIGMDIDSLPEAFDFLQYLLTGDWFRNKTQVVKVEPCKEQNRAGHNMWVRGET